MQKDGRVLYLTEANKANQYWNIPIANTTVILLGTGTSITQAAMRMLASAGVLTGFCGGGGSPLFAGGEVEWLTPQSEYRPTEYMQGWMRFWFDENKRLKVAKKFQKARLHYLKKIWCKDKSLQEEGFIIDDPTLIQMLRRAECAIEQAGHTGQLLLAEAELTKNLYRFSARVTGDNNFIRNHENSDTCTANAFLNHGNYLAYGLAATTLWVLGISHSFAVMHGKTRRGALVFDIADLIKDTLVLPWAFISAKEGATEQEFRQQCLQNFTDHKALDFMFEEVKSVAMQKSDREISE